MRRIPDASAESLLPFIKENFEPGSTDGWAGYVLVAATGYDHEVSILKGKKRRPPHRVASLLKRWLMCTDQTTRLISDADTAAKLGLKFCQISRVILHASAKR